MARTAVVVRTKTSTKTKNSTKTSTTNDKDSKKVEYVWGKGNILGTK